MEAHEMTESPMATKDETLPGSALAAALAKAQAEMKNAPLNKTNPAYKSRYADLASIRDATIPYLAKHGIMLTQYTTFVDSTLILHTRMQHSSGEMLESEYPIAIDKPQVMGSAITYGKRYCWSAMCGIAAEDDDDANAAQAGGAVPKGRPATAVIADPAGVSKRRAPGEGVEPKVDEMWGGPLSKTAFGEAMRDLQADIDACEDHDSLVALLESEPVKALIKQCKADRPSWWETKPGSDVLGMGDRIQQALHDLLEREAMAEG